MSANYGYAYICCWWLPLPDVGLIVTGWWRVRWGDGATDLTVFVRMWSKFTLPLLTMSWEGGQLARCCDR